MPFAIRQATLSDLELVVPLFVKYLKFYGKTPEVAQARDFIQNRFKANDSYIFLATDKETELGVGFVQLYPSLSSLSMQRILILNDLYVSESHRRQGLARTLMKTAESFARENNAVSLSLSTALNNSGAQRLYESEGYTRDTTFCEYSKSLVPKPVVTSEVTLDAPRSRMS
jgi:ribosomal protein S18 acetylase RimI-like enzyme